MSLQVIGRTLQVLEISGNGIQHLKPFGVLYELRRIYAGDNQIQDLTEIEYGKSLPRTPPAPPAPPLASLS